MSLIPLSKSSAECRLIIRHPVLNLQQSAEPHIQVLYEKAVWTGDPSDGPANANKHYVTKGALLCRDLEHLDAEGITVTLFEAEI